MEDVFYLIKLFVKKSIQKIIGIICITKQILFNHVIFLFFNNRIAPIKELIIVNRGRTNITNIIRQKLNNKLMSSVQSNAKIAIHEVKSNPIVDHKIK